MTNDLKNTGPRITGELIRKTGVEVVSATKNRIIAVAMIDVDYAMFVTQGTGFHTIRPKRSGGVLVFKVGGVTVFATKVNHPGNDPNPFFDKVIKRWNRYLKLAG